MSSKIIAIDGPAGAGKSTAARRLADRLGYVLLDTGALYRAVALAARRAQLDWADGEAVGALARQLVADEALAMVRADDGSMRIELRGEDVSAAIRDQEISAGASQVSAFGPVRDALLGLQRHIGHSGKGVVAEGRDMGTVVFPDAPVKFFLTASLEVRAQRRFEELSARGKNVSLEETIREVEQRDHNDSSRAVAPLRQAEDAIRIDSTAVDLDGVVDDMLARVKTRWEDA